VDLVQNRECGECTVCCTVLLIDDPDFQKLPGVTCPNCKAGAGCQIYAMRPGACRGFYCGWRYMAELPEQLRPDRSGIMVRFIREHIPPGLKPVGLNFLLFDRRDVIGPGLADYFGRLVADNTAVFLSIRGPAGLSDGAVLLNSHIAPLAGNAAKIVSVLHAALRALAENKFEPALFRYGKRAAPL
jgi:hypothetical protein